MGEPNVAELAIAAWRLERWLDNLNAERKMAAKKSIREIKKFLDASNIEIVDPLGWKFDPGSAVEVVNNEADDVDEEDLIIIQTNSPIIKQGGAVVQYGKVILGQEIKEQKSNNELRDPGGPNQGKTATPNHKDDGMLSQGPISVANFGGYPCWVRKFNCKAMKVGYHALIGVFTNVNTEICLMDEQVFKEYQAGFAPRNPFIYKPRPSATYITPPYPDVWYLVVWPLPGDKETKARFDSNCEWAINQDSLKKSDRETDDVRNSQETVDQRDVKNSSKEGKSGDKSAVVNDKVEFCIQADNVTGTEGKGDSTKQDVPDMSEKALERLKKKNISSYNLHRAMDKGLIHQIHGKKKK